MDNPIWAQGYRVENEYTFGMYPAMNPDTLIAYALFQGVKPDVPLLADSARELVYCELGSGQGVTLNFLAARDPAGSYYGVDYNPNHVRNSRAFAKAAGLDNAHFIERSFAELDALDIPDCDVIALHGIWSWIDEAMRAAIVRFIDRKLKPGGLVYQSYNCAVGRSGDEPMRQLFLALERTSKARALDARMGDIFQTSRQLAELGAGYFANRPATTARLGGTSAHDANYMEHEYFGGSWTNFYFDDVAREMGEAKTAFVCSTTMMRNMIEYVLPAPALEQIDRFATEADQELLKDVWQDTLFRQDVYVKGVQRLTPPEIRRELGRCRFALARMRADCSLTVSLGSGTGELPEVPYTGILDALARGPMMGEALFAEVDALGVGIDPVAAVKSLIAFGYVVPVPDAASVDKAQTGLAGFEVAYDRLVASKINRFVGVVPGLLTTAFLSMLDYYFWRAERQGVPDKPEWVYEQMVAAERYVTFEGQPVAEKDRSLELLREYQSTFEQRARPMLALGEGGRGQRKA